MSASDKETRGTAPAAPGRLIDALSEALSRRETRSARRRLTILPQETVDFSSNDFLSLATSPAYRTRFLGHLNSVPEGFPFASGGSRLLDGNSAYAEDLERFVADFHRAPTALLFNSGFDANVGVLSSIPQPGDLLLYDELIHASVHEGMRLSRAGKRVMFAHSSPQGLRGALEAQIKEDPKVHQGAKNVFVVIESIYSMDGDVAPIKEFIEVVDELLPQQNGYFIVDEAHATGVFGPRGAGVVQELGVQDRIFIRVHTFGKALASHGAMVLCGPETRDYLINYARSLIYTTALGFPFLASIRTAYELLSAGETQPLQGQLQRLIRHLHGRLATLRTSPSVLFEVDHFPTSPIFSLRTSQPRQLASACQQDGYIVRAIMPPTIPEGKERVRVCLHAGNTEQEIDGLIQSIQSWLDLSGKQMTKL
ncbi:Pyridoxal phosphate-dependent transferase major region subdomain 2 [Penicillium argentinense]|uniref:Pyridoxal phosphate-dependent transferase major region subdomain 2 n=1 Tax=Penicillium argentinense TaxID=1131581 RepID=A0A9W9EZT2_9EURO|nr:Pyridoxal phosphate-dependent transferase major region subdomain 2 [Penicillium argentinense]KAJ5090997.1 Pyridoxal phosphate-dependent transferase major region subdomain 2 [Penicillium argentinense]